MSNRSGSGFTPWFALRKFAFPALWLLLLAFFFLLREVAAPFIGAILLAYLLAPLVGRLARLRLPLGKRRWPVPRWVAVVVIYAALALVAVAYCMLAVPRVSAEFGKLAREGQNWLHSLTPEKLQEHSRAVKQWFEKSGLPVHVVTPAGAGGEEPTGGFVLRLDDILQDSLTELTEAVREGLVTFLKLGPKFAAGLFRNVVMAFLILMVAAFLLIRPERVFGFLRSLFPPRLHGGFDEVLVETDRGLAGVVRGQVIICLVNGVLTLAGLLIIGVKFPVLLSTLAAVMSLIPIFGSILSSIPIVIVALTAGLGTGVAVLLWIIGIHLLEANLLNPKIMGEAAKIHPALVVFVLLAGEHFYGVVGALFAVPVTSVGLAVFKVFHRRAVRWAAEAAAEAPARTEPAAGGGVEK